MEQIAKQKFIILLLSVRKFIHKVRINLFARFMGLLDDKLNLKLVCLNKYIQSLEYFHKGQSSKYMNNILDNALNNFETEEVFRVNLIKV